MRLGIDLDGVVVDSHTPMNDFLAGFLHKPLAKVDRWEWFTNYGPEGRQAWQTLWQRHIPEGMFLDCDPLPGAVGALYLLRKEHEVVFVTHRESRFGADTRRWLDGWGFESNKLVLAPRGSDKSLAGCDLYLDDKPDTVAALRAKNIPAVLFKQPWNTHAWFVLPSVSEWGEFVEGVARRRAL